MKATIRQNAYDNWYGYIGGKKVISFGNDLHGATQEEKANAWLKAQSPKKRGRPFTVHADHPIAFRLDTATVKKIDTYAKRWQCSKAEIIRRAVDQLK